ncbi:uncharacterized protein LOC109725180 isoform X2 [Ananas comosus]|uniref:Uncharacterized protein LOC109725180 isoform X2 n=1 Tax=Ananas comosus TaxID=4615 RepID=A0A6P5GME5_ANACO|nr:uncharacterized protein LOC109725180 isoform X2 [Ananas comosus]
MASAPFSAHGFLLLRRRRSASQPLLSFHPSPISGAAGPAMKACMQSFSRFDFQITKASVSGLEPSNDDNEINEMLEGLEAKPSSPGTSFLAKLAVAVGIAATVTLISVYLKWPSSGTSFSFLHFVDDSSQSNPLPSPVGFTLELFGNKIVLPERTLGWIYFWLLMAAGCGLFISEEALNIWVGISLARSLSLNGNWQTLATSLSANAHFIVSTVLWVYWGVCISDMIPFYLGRAFRQTKASENLLSKLGIGKEKALSITRVVQKYGNLIGFVERFSLGVRNPTAFLAGALGISADCFFAGVCCGGLITLPLQLAVGFLLRERPVVALASVAAAVGIWTIFPYLIAASTALFLFLRQHRSSSN